MNLLLLRQTLKIDEALVHPESEPQDQMFQPAPSSEPKPLPPLLMPSEKWLADRFSKLDVSHQEDVPDGKPLPKPKTGDIKKEKNWYVMTDSPWSQTPLELKNNVSSLYRLHPNATPGCRVSQSDVQKWEGWARNWISMMGYGSYFLQAQQTLNNRNLLILNRWYARPPTNEEVDEIYSNSVPLQNIQNMQSNMMSKLTDQLLRHMANLVLIRRDAVLSNLHPACSAEKARLLRNSSFKGPLLFPSELV